MSRRRRFLMAAVVATVVVGAAGVGGVALAEVADAPEEAVHFPAIRNCAPLVQTWDDADRRPGATAVRFTVPRRTFVHDADGGLLVSTNTHESPCVRDEILTCDLELLACQPASAERRAWVLGADMPNVWPAPGVWVSL